MVRAWMPRPDHTTSASVDRRRRRRHRHRPVASDDDDDEEEEEEGVTDESDAAAASTDDSEEEQEMAPPTVVVPWSNDGRPPTATASARPSPPPRRPAWRMALLAAASLLFAATLLALAARRGGGMTGGLPSLFGVSVDDDGGGDGDATAGTDAGAGTGAPGRLGRPPSHPSFDLVDADSLPELGGDLYVYRHRRTEAELASFVPRRRGEEQPALRANQQQQQQQEQQEQRWADDKAFGISFRTPPPSSSGVPHILEHSVLCGSHSFPTRDPFADLLKGSLQTYLNALTYPDRTMFPAASRNGQDFRNLVRVYLDAVFRPRCVEDVGWWVLRQEGWRYEFVAAVDGDGSGGGGGNGGGGNGNGTGTGPAAAPPPPPDGGERLVYRGVVLSEMLGAYSDPEEVLYQTSQSELFPDTPYRFDSGGDPTDLAGGIPALTREEFVTYYRSFYHPTNSKAFVSGDDDDVVDVLSMVDEYAGRYELDGTSRGGSTVPYQRKRFREVRRVSRPYASPSSSGGRGGGEGEEEGGGGGGEGRMVLMTWLLNDDGPLPSVSELALTVLDGMLLGTASSSLTKALIDSGWGEDVLDDGLDTSLLQATYQVGMKGVKDEGGLAKVEGLVMETLETLARDGFDDDDVEASMNSIEFKLREFNSGGTPRGIILFEQVMNKWNYDVHPRNALAFEDVLAELKGTIAKLGSSIFQDLIRDYFLNNTHRVVVDLYPSSTLEADQLKEEKNHLAKIKEQLSPQEYQDIKDQAKALEEIQSTDDPPDAVASIPSLTLDDLDRLGVEYPISVHPNAFDSGATVVTHTVPSSLGIVYADFGIDISKIPPSKTFPSYPSLNACCSRRAPTRCRTLSWNGRFRCTPVVSKLALWSNRCPHMGWRRG